MTPDENPEVSMTEDLSDPGPGATAPVVSRTVVEDAPPAPVIPILEKTNAEIEHGRAAVKRHEDRERMIAAKRAKELRGETEEASAAVAAEANKDL